MNGYDLHRQWFDFAFDNQGVVQPKHTALYMWVVEKNNRMGWVDSFGLPMDEAGAAIGVKKIQVVREALKDLEEWGFVRFVVRSKNQFSANIISIKNCQVESSDSLDNALRMTSKGSSIGSSKGSASGLPEGSSIGSSKGSASVPINKPLNLETFKPLNHETEAREEENYDEIEDSKKKEKKLAPKKERPGIEEFVEYGLAVVPGLSTANTEGWTFTLRSKFNAWSENGWKDGFGKPILNWKTKIQNTIPHLKPASNAIISQTREQRVDSVRAVGDYARQVIKNARPVGS